MSGWGGRGRGATPRPGRGPRGAPRGVALTCLLSAACETGNVRDARRPDIITEEGTRIQWEESEAEPFVLDGACPAQEWTIRLCATGAWTRRWPIVSFEAGAERAQPLSVAIAPDETDFAVASDVALEVGPATALRQIFGDDGRSSQIDCQDYALTFTTTSTGEVSGQWFVAGFVEGHAGADVATLTVQPGAGCP